MGANRLTHEARSLDRSVVSLFGEVTFGGSGAVSSQDCLGFTISKPSGTGLYRCTLEDKWHQLLGASLHLDDNGTATGNRLEVADVDLANKIVDFRCVTGAAGGTEARVVEFSKTAIDSAAGDATAETVVGYTSDAVTLVDVTYVPAAALTADNANYATITVSKRTSAGASKTTVAQVTTQITGSGNWTAWAGVDLPLAADPAPTIAAGSGFTFEIAKTGTGVQVPAGMLVLTVLGTGGTTVAAANATSGHRALVVLHMRNTSVPRKGA